MLRTNNLFFLCFLVFYLKILEFINNNQQKNKLIMCMHNKMKYITLLIFAINCCLFISIIDLYDI